jgi:uncharacterized coiled-coil DUF342 family protein
MDLDEYTKALDDEVSDRKQLNLYNKTLRERIQKVQDGLLFRLFFDFNPLFEGSRELLQETHRKVDRVKKNIADLDRKIQSLPDLTTLR